MSSKKAMPFNQKQQKGYNGNTAVKVAGEQHQYTLEEIKDFQKCMTDPSYFINNFVKIVNIDKGVIPFKTYEFQDRIIKAITDNRFTICKLFRQSGKTTVVSAYCLWFALFHSNKEVMILANKLATSLEIMSRIVFSYESLPDFLKWGVKEYNKSSITFENGSKIKCQATSASAIRGRSVALLIIDEFAFLNKDLAEEFIASSFPALSSSSESKLVLISTPFGLNHFYKIWHNSEQGLNNFVRVEGKWQEARTQEWYEEQCKLLGYDKVKIAQEIECVVGDTLITVRNDDSGEIFTLPIEKFYNWLPV